MTEWLFEQIQTGPFWAALLSTSFTIALLKFLKQSSHRGYVPSDMVCDMTFTNKAGREQRDLVSAQTWRDEIHPQPVTKHGDWRPRQPGELAL